MKTLFSSNDGHQSVFGGRNGGGEEEQKGRSLPSKAVLVNNLITDDHIDIFSLTKPGYVTMNMLASINPLLPPY